MARMRNIKSEFFLHEDLAELSPLHRLLFIGLWTLADREGRMECRPKRIKAALLPWDNCDIDELLADLNEAEFIQIYEVDGDQFLFIPSFKKHQRPHPKEPSAGIPDPPSREKTRRATAASKPRLSREKKRQEINDPSVIPSSPVDLDYGVLSIENGVTDTAAAAPPPESKQRVPIVPPPVQPPETPSDVWGGVDFWRWAQSVRQDGGHRAEKRPNERALNAWFNAIRLEGVSPEALKEGFYRFGEDTYWENSNPPFPFGAFQDQWAKYTREEVPRGIAS